MINLKLPNSPSTINCVNNFSLLTELTQIDPLDPSLHLTSRLALASYHKVTTCHSLCCAGGVLSADHLSAVAGRPCVAATGQSAGCLDSYLIRR